MIVVDKLGDSWYWKMISAEGRLLVYDNIAYQTEKAAFKAALSYRIKFWGIADHIDHRMGACI